MKWKKIKPDFKKTFTITSKIALAAIFIASVGFTIHKNHLLTCSDIRISIDDSAGNAFITNQDIEKVIEHKFGPLTGIPVANINTALLEKTIDNNPFVLKAEVFSTINGKLLIEVKQRTPLVRIVNSFNESFYMDDHGMLMPESENFTARVPVANGQIEGRLSHAGVDPITEVADTSRSYSVLQKLYYITSYIRSNDFWNAQIEQIYVNDKGEFEFVPRVGNHIIVFGGIDKMEEKFSKLFLFYKNGLSTTGWNQYKTVNLVYEDQVVCIKK